MLLLEITGLILAGMFVLSFLTSAAFNGFGGIGDMVVVSVFGNVVRLPFLLIIVLKYLLYMLPVLAYGGLALMLSAVTAKAPVSIAVSLLLMFGSKAGMLMVVLGSVAMLGAPAARAEIPALRQRGSVGLFPRRFLPDGEDVRHEHQPGHL